MGSTTGMFTQRATWDSALARDLTCYLSSSPTRDICADRQGNSDCRRICEHIRHVDVQIRVWTNGVSLIRCTIQPAGWVEVVRVISPPRLESAPTIRRTIIAGDQANLWYDAMDNVTTCPFRIGIWFTRSPFEMVIASASGIVVSYTATRSASGPAG